MKTITALVSLIAFTGCVSARIIQVREDGSSTEIVSNFLPTGHADQLLRTTQNGNNETVAIEVNGKNGFPVSVANKDGSVTGGFPFGAGVYGYGANGVPYNEYSASLDRLDAALPLQPPSEGTGTTDPRVDGLVQDVRSLQKDRARQFDTATETK